MKTSRVWSITLTLACLLGFPVVAALPVPASNPTSIEKCGVLVAGPDGKDQVVLLPSLSVLTLSDDSTFVLPADAPSGVHVVQCGRGALVPRRNDYKVIAAGFPFIIVADDRIGALEIVDGQLQFNMLKGEMTEPEISLIQAFLNSAQTAMDAKR